MFFLYLLLCHYEAGSMKCDYIVPANASVHRSYAECLSSGYRMAAALKVSGLACMDKKNVE